MAEASKVVAKNKKKRAARKGKESSSAPHDTTPDKPHQDPLSLLKQEIEDAKSAKDHKKAQELRAQLWKLQDTMSLGTVGENAPETDTELVGKLLDQQNPSQSPSHLPSSCEPDLTRKRLKTLSKKLKQIEDLKEKQAKGIHLEANQLEKLTRESEIRQEILECEDILGTT